MWMEATPAADSSRAISTTPLARALGAATAGVLGAAGGGAVTRVEADVIVPDGNEESIVSIIEK
jgi:hypothetical protein